MNQLIIGSSLGGSYTRPENDPNLRKVGYNRKTKFYHRIKYNGGFYTAFCESGTRITHFEKLEDMKGVMPPCKKCFPKGEPVPESETQNLDWQGPWQIVQVSGMDKAFCVARMKTSGPTAFGPFTEEKAKELFGYLTNPDLD